MLLNKPAQPVFDYRALRLVVGIIALTLPITVTLLSNQQLESISASYYTNARDTFVGLMFVVAAFLFAYHGWSAQQAIASKFAALGAGVLALFPTACKLCEPDFNAHMHQAGATVLFAVLAYFCLGPFRDKTKGRGGKKALRSHIYLCCGCLILLSMLAIALLPMEFKNAHRVVFFAEWLALSAFGVAWIVAGKVIAPLVHEDEQLILFGDRNKA